MRQDGGGGERGPAITVSEAAAGAPGAKMIRRAEGGRRGSRKTDGRTNTIASDTSDSDSKYFKNAVLLCGRK